jgi:hypothetical protein
MVVRRKRDEVHIIKMKKCIQKFSQKNKGKKPLGRARHRREDNIKLNLELK